MRLPSEEIPGRYRNRDDRTRIEYEARNCTVPSVETDAFETVIHADGRPNRNTCNHERDKENAREYLNGS